MKHKSIFFSISLVFSLILSFGAELLPKEVVWQEVEGVNIAKLYASNAPPFVRSLI